MCKCTRLRARRGFVGDKYASPAVVFAASIDLYKLELFFAVLASVLLTASSRRRVQKRAVRINWCTQEPLEIVLQPCAAPSP